MLNYFVLNFITGKNSSINPSQPPFSDDVCLYQRTTPSLGIFLVYGLAVPTLSSFGLCANLINAIVFMRPKMTPSAFTYLAALSWLDCVSCLLITLTALSRSYFYKVPAWVAYDYQWQTPLFGISTGAANLILAFVSLDRFIYLYKCTGGKHGAPKFCRRKVARIMISLAIITSIVVNMPYFFCFVVDHTATCHVTEFYYSNFYKIHNWFSFILLALLPALFLLVGNTAIIITFRRWTKQGKRCRRSCPTDNSHKRYQHQVKLTISILIVITLYMVGELPAHMTSRKSSLNLLFGGDTNKMNEELMEHLEVLFITLNALQLSLNIVVYAVINPSFMPEFFTCMRSASDVCFRLCCLPNMKRGCQWCWTWRKRRRQPHAEDCVASSVEVQQLPPDEAPHCGCESWSSDSGCVDATHCKTMVGTFSYNCPPDEEDVQPEPPPQPEVFITKASGCILPKLEEDTNLGACTM